MQAIASSLLGNVLVGVTTASARGAAEGIPGRLRKPIRKVPVAPEVSTYVPILVCGMLPTSWPPSRLPCLHLLFLAPGSLWPAHHRASNPSPPILLPGHLCRSQPVLLAQSWKYFQPVTPQRTLAENLGQMDTARWGSSALLYTVCTGAGESRHRALLASVPVEHSSAPAVGSSPPLGVVPWSHGDGETLLGWHSSVCLCGWPRHTVHID